MDGQGKSTHGKGRASAKALGWKVQGSFRKSGEAGMVWLEHRQPGEQQGCVRSGIAFFLSFFLKIIYSFETMHGSQTVTYSTSPNGARTELAP